MFQNRETSMGSLTIGDELKVIMSSATMCTLKQAEIPPVMLENGSTNSPDSQFSDFGGTMGGRISPAAPEQHQQPQSPDAICSLLQSIESEISNYQEELATYQICARLKSTQQTPGMLDSFQSAMELMERKISTHLQKVRLIGSCPKFNCNMHSLSTENLGNPSATSQSASNNLKRAPDRDNDGFQLSPERNTVKPPMFTFPNSVPTPNKFAHLESLPTPDPPTPQAPRIPP
ncbi:hypothetical protein CEXT_612571 [Caerostris extrusa]|uniref:Uncharacterized protein n=1 Tax=Caerostris extrusa TaxID=172846 RepID=A0AAV4V6J4_CAEEX|nr:hypothetical protein CEXT_612571 [Caerostris extrusa]